ncbi:cyclopropane-fatty-acyl-phospholipid synthase [Erysiphe pulchra]|uniref:Cyclopropane-fatty-acyl-phospholipid synthase n=1 Tax=Erysiphe pulchra TaxID=225359 RepID=A0A2S4Q0L5_9PEZI|nr:cyclopropane-fatty-acyl-phospholipid synthase [Erysiphe pulchra]
MAIQVPALFTKPWIYGLDVARGVLGAVSWGPAITVSKAVVTSLFSQIKVGQLEIFIEETGETIIYGQKIMIDRSEAASGQININGTKHSYFKIPKVKLIVKRGSFWLRLMLFGDIGFAEAYMLGDFECSDLATFFEIFIKNREQLANATTITSSIAATITSLARSTNTLSNSLLNISAHYDISNEMFASFLSEDMTYSCPIWKPVVGADVEEDLKSAQMTKINRIIREARIKNTDHVLEIGTGWGSFAIEAVRKTGCRVTTLTLSTEQKKLAEVRIAAAGYKDRIKVLLMDYRALPIPKIPYDKIVSIEMLEAVGKEYLETYFSCVHKLLKKDGIAVFQCITMPEGRYEEYAKGEDFIRKYIFPGGHLPSISQLVTNISKGSEGTLVVERIDNIGGHYARTLRLWKEEFLRNFESHIKPALLANSKNMEQSEIEVFRRKWEYYFVYCEAGFATKTLGDVIITVGREGAMELMEGIPR